MEFRILGPMEVLEGDRSLGLPGQRQRSLLALLLLHANQVVSTSRLIEELWPEGASESQAGALQASVSRLRKSLGAGAGLVVTLPTGYTIRLAPDQLDLERFERLVRDAAGNAEPHEAAEKLREALALWRGPALADFAYEPFAQAAIDRLEEVHLLALEMRIDADLAVGRHAALVPELDALASQHPLRERLHSQLMLALYRSGRQADALAAYQTVRRVLVDELGIEPSAALQDLERAILRQDPSLELAQPTTQERSILVVLGDGPPEPLLAVSEPLARNGRREVIIARLIADRAELSAGAESLKRHSEALSSSGIVARAAVFTSASPGADASRLAAEQDVDLVLVEAPVALLDDHDLGDLLSSAPCDVAVLTGHEPAVGPVLVPFAGTDHDWSAIELGAWLAGSWRVPLRLAGPAAEGGRDASRLLASASLAVQRALGVASEPLLVEPGPEALVAASADAGVTVTGLSDRWQRDGLGPSRAALAGSGNPTMLVRKGLRPGGLAPAENLTRFTWSLRA